MVFRHKSLGLKCKWSVKIIAGKVIDGGSVASTDDIVSESIISVGCPIAGNDIGNSGAVFVLKRVVVTNHKLVTTSGRGGDSDVVGSSGANSWDESSEGNI